jgi:phospholipid/cholesterol/gamma-HCH transport system substrate-binding protein
MQRSPVRDLIIGIFVLCGLASIGYMSIQLGGLYYSGPSGFKVVATCDHIGDLKVRAAVQIAGVKVGEVVSIELDEFMRAKVQMDVDPTLGLDVETAAAVQTAGLLGAKFVALEPGAADDMLQSGDQLDRCDPAISLESLIGKFINNADL